MNRNPDERDDTSGTEPVEALDGTPANRVDRRTVLGALAGAGSAAVAGCSGSEPDDAATDALDSETLDELATRFAPTLFFDSAEPWFPTDPRPYTSDADGETVVDGFAAFDGYHERYDETGEPPDPTVFYNGVRYEDSPLAVVQFWLYSAFDQFTANFHWHDWEVLHVFVDLDSGDPQLYVASSHSRSVPNNEFLDPEPDATPRILSELGSHSSTLSVNENPDQFQRVGEAGLLADITNTTIDTVEDLLGIPLAYGLPRDEGMRLPFVVPEYEGEPLYEHPDLPSVSAESLVDDALTIRSLDALRSPPTDLPFRETGIAFRHADREDEVAGRTAAEVIGYDLVETAELEEISAFTGPQLSYEFAVPEVVEDAVAGHITTTGVPWEQPRYENPALDVTAGNHRAELAGRYDAIAAEESFGDATTAELDAVVARVTRATETDEAPDGEGLTTTEAITESVALIESDPEAVPTFAGGVAVANGVPEGDHRLTVNGAGQAPHSETLTVSPDEPVTTAGVDGEVPLVARENARKVAIDDANSDVDLARTAVEDDFAGRIYDSAIDGSDAVYVHAGGAYTTEVRDAADEIGAYRVNPDPSSGGDDSDDSDDGDDGGDGDGTPGNSPIRIERPETGAAPLAGYVADVAEETRAAVAAAAESDDGDSDDTSGEGSGSGGGPSNAVNGLERALAAAVAAARRAEERAREGDSEGTDRQLGNVADRIARIEDRLAAARDGLPPGLANATRKRVKQATKRVEQAQNAGNS